MKIFYFARVKNIIPAIGMLITLVFSCKPAFATHTFTKEDPIDSSKVRMFTIGLNYNSNATFFGRNAAGKTPLLSTDLTYSAKSGFWISTSLIKTLNTQSWVDGADLSAGWQHNFTDRIDASIGYSMYFFNSNSELIQSVATNMGYGHLGLDWGVLYSVLGLTVIRGDKTDFFISFSNSRYFEKEHIFSKHDFISTEPRLSLIAGTQHFAESHIEKVISNETTEDPNKNPNQGGPKQDNTQETTQVIQTNGSQFNILNYELRVPLAYTYKNLTLEGAWTYTIPVNLLEGDVSDNQSIFSLSVFYVFQKQ